MNVTRYKILSGNSLEDLESKMNQANAYEAITISAGQGQHPWVALMRFIPQQENQQRLRGPAYVNGQ